MTPPHLTEQVTSPRRRYWLRLLSIFLVALSVGLVIVPMFLGVSSIWGLTHPPCYVGSDPGSFNAAFEDIAFTSANGLHQQGYFIPGTNGATIIIVPTYNMGRGGQMNYAQVFNQAGFNVLTLNSRVCAGQGWISLGYQEVEDVRAAFEYLKTRPDVDTARVGLHGFSSATATSIIAAARIPEIRSVSVEGGYHDYLSVLEWGHAANYFDALYQVGFMLGYRLITGDNLQTLKPIDWIDRLGSRPLLLIYGSTEVSLPGARQMLDRAQESGVPAELWVVDGAGHGNYLYIAPDEYRQRVIGFHLAALVDSNAS